jgi:uncharacterized protein YehS (DUF1456 family)
MKNNQILKTLVQAKKINADQCVQILHKAGFAIEGEILTACLKEDDEPGYVPCSDALLNQILEAVRIEFRGLREGEALPAQANSKPMNNNELLKKIRIALNLQAIDLESIFETSGDLFSKHEISALFRKEGQKHFKICSDQIFNNFLQGLSIWAGRQ